jgi:hypothetical protein
MGFPAGRRLTILGAALIALAAVAAVRVAVTGGVAGTATRTAVRGTDTAAGTAAVSAGEAALAAARHVALARSAEGRGDVAAALSHYRAAVAGDPRCVDRRSPGYLGDAFEEKLKGWIAGMKSGRIAAGPAARDDASFIFRTMYGGCG